MIKIIANIFSKREDVHKTSIVIEKEKTPEELFDKAVQRVIFEEQSKALKKQLSEMCYTEEQIKQTKAAIDKYGCGDLCVGSTQIKLDFPKAVFMHSRYDTVLGLGFKLDLFVKNIIEGRCQ